MARSCRPILDAAAGNVLAMIALHQDRPCPTNAEIREWTAIPRRRIAPFLESLAARGIIGIETNERLQRRMRAVGGVWTGWTLRSLNALQPIPAAAENRLLALIGRHRDRPCPTVMQMRIYYTKGYTSITCKTSSGEIQAAGKVGFDGL